MASFTESATLKINDQSSKQIAQINSQLRQLFTTANRIRKLTIDTKGLKNVRNEVRGIANDLKKLPRQRTVNVNLNQRGTVPKIPAGGGAGRVGVRGTGGGSGGGGAGMFASNGLLRIAQATITSYGAIRIGSAALTAVNEAQAQDTRQAAIFGNDPALIRAIVQAANVATLNAPRIDQTRGRQIATDLALGGVTKERLAGFTSLFANTESTVGALFPGLENSVTAFNNKVINLANSTDDLARSQKLAQGAAQGIAAAGETFSQANALTALRFSGLAPTIDQQGLFNLIQIVDAIGGSAGQAISRLRKELFIPANQAGAGSGIAKGAVKNLERNGLRGFSDAERSLFTQDPARFIEQALGPRIRKAGIDTDNREQLQKFLEQAGFNNTTQRLILQVLTSIDERQQQFKATSGINVADPNAGTEGNLALATQNLIKSFNTLSANVLTPIAETAAPIVNNLAQFVEKVAITGSTFDKLKLGAEGAALAFGGFVGAKSIVSTLFNPLNVSAGALNGSALALTRAAGVLGGAGVVGAAGGGAGAAAAGAAGVAGGVAAKKGIGSLLLKGAGIIGTAITVNDILGALDPGGNLWGLTSGIDSYVESKIGINPSNPTKNIPPITNQIEPDRAAALDSFLAGPIQPTQFEQAFTTGGEVAGQSLESGLTSGAQGMAGILANAFSAGAGVLADRIQAAISNAVINAPPALPAAPVADTGGNDKRNQ